MRQRGRGHFISFCFISFSGLMCKECFVSMNWSGCKMNRQRAGSREIDWCDEWVLVCSLDCNQGAPMI